jgi:2-C-methyl-D-erythritol 4-phosphate cytidylyltransferase
MRYWLVMPAAGVGRRFGEAIPKQYADLHGRCVIEWALEPFLDDTRCAAVVVVVASADQRWPAIETRLRRRGNPDDPTVLRNAALSRVGAAPGGADRSESVRSGLRALAGRAVAADWILVHDAARPCIGVQDLDRLLERTGQHPVGGILAARAADTLKRASDDKEILETVDRSSLWRALTPQMFRYGPLCEALDRAHALGRRPTDEAQALEWLGERPILVEGSTANIKITSAADLVIAAALLGARATAGRAPCE